MDDKHRKRYMPKRRIKEENIQVMRDKHFKIYYKLQLHCKNTQKKKIFD